LHTITPHLTLNDAARTIDWYKRALGAREVSRSLDPNGKIMHAEIEIGNSRFYANDVMMGKGPKEYGGSPAAFWIYVPDCDALFRQATAAGGEVTMPLQDQFWGDRSGGIRDPEGYTWWIATRKEDLTPDETKHRADEFFKSMAQSAKP
jgi:PhnB protein